MDSLTCQRIRGVLVHDNALYKLTFYLLTYLLWRVRTTIEDISVCLTPLHTSNFLFWFFDTPFITYLLNRNLVSNMWVRGSQLQIQIRLKAAVS